MRLIRMNKRSRYKGLSCMYCNKYIEDDRVALCSTLYVYPDTPHAYDPPAGTEWWEPFSFSVRDMVKRKHDDYDENMDREVRVKVGWHRLCLEKILANPKGPYDPATVATMYEEYRASLLERFEERLPGSVRYPSESLPKVPGEG